MKKTFSVIIALLMCVAVLFTGCNDATTPGGVVDNSEPADDVVVNVKSDIEIIEGETTVEEDLGKEVDMFIEGKYYLEGTIYSEGEPMPVVLSTDGKNLQFTANISGISFCVLVLDDATYAVLPNEKKYTPLSDTLLEALDVADEISVSEFQAIKDEGESKASITQTAVTINGEAGLSTVYTYEDTVVKLYSIGEDLIQVENFDAEGNMTMQIVVDKIDAQIPADQLTLKGYEEAGVTSFISSFIGSVS